jgi:glycosyltransferase involved in cell wall biosynthesis
VDPLAWHVIQIETVARRADEFDILHFHTDYLHFPVSSRIPTPHVTTLHGRLDLPELPLVHAMYSGTPLISISDAQREPLPDLCWRATIHHGLPQHCVEHHSGVTEHLLFLGRISPEKGTDRAIEIAIRSDRPLIIAAKVDRADREYFRERIAPLLDHPLISYVGEVDEQGKRALLHKAIALLFPISWPEPFGMVMIEAMAKGVPVIAFPGGSVREVVDHGKTGFIVRTAEEAAEAVEAIGSISRRHCCEAVSTRFSAARMAREYVKEFERLIHGENNVSTDLELTEV